MIGVGVLVLCSVDGCVTVWLLTARRLHRSHMLGTGIMILGARGVIETTLICTHTHTHAHVLCVVVVVIVAGG